MLHISVFNILVQYDLSSSLCMLLQYLTCLLASLKVVGNTQVNHSIQIIEDLLGQMIIFWLSILVSHTYSCMCNLTRQTGSIEACCRSTFARYT